MGMHNPPASEVDTCTDGDYVASKACELRSLAVEDFGRELIVTPAQLHGGSIMLSGRETSRAIARNQRAPLRYYPNVVLKSSSELQHQY